MGTHPIFESDFDCLTEKLKKEKMGIDVAQTLTTNRFDQLRPALDERLLTAVMKGEKFEFMTTVQSHVVPLFMGNKDVMCEACTGSGKTLSFVLPSLHRLLNMSELTGFALLIISPTRELASQTHQVIMRLLEHFDASKLRVTTCIGGVNKLEENLTEIDELKPNVVIATPGRLDDLIRRSPLVKSNMKRLEVLIIDEADQMLDIGFEKAINFILSHCPKQRRTGLFSATLNDSVLRLKKAGLRNPHSVTVKEKHEEELSTPSQLHLSYIIMKPEMKLSVLLALLKKNTQRRVLVYFLTCDMVDYFHAILRQLAPQLIMKCHRKLTPKARADSVRDFAARGDKGACMLATDLLGRGVDLSSGVDLVIQFDAPRDAKFFVHRAGRAARAGKKGESVLLLTEDEEANNYRDFIARNQKIGEMDKIEIEAPQIPIDTIRQLQLKDKRLFEMAQKAFPSFIMAYKNHECKYIFRERDLLRSVGHYATCFGLLRMPKMEELKRRKEIEGFTDADFDQSKLQYKDKSIRNQRAITEQKRLEERNKAAERKKAEKHKSWSIHKDKKMKKELKRKKKEEKAERVLSTAEMDDLNEDYKNLKKRMRGIISEKELDVKMGIE